MLLSSLLSRLVLVGSLIAATVPGLAQEYPNKPVRITMGFAPGGSTDMIARAIAAGLSKSLGQQFFVENKPGANGVVATTPFVKAPPDGYNLLMTLSSHVTNMLVYDKLPYSLKDFQPISMVATSPFVLVANPRFGPRSVKELMDFVKQGNSIDYASPGTGSTQHLAMELMNAMAGVKMTHIPYKGGAPAMTDVIAGVVPITLLTPVQSLPFLKDGRLKALAVSPARRISILPDVPTVSESGLPGYEANVWFGILAPAGTPRPIVDKLNAEIVRLFKSPEMTKMLSELGAEAVGTTPEAFSALMEADFVKWGAIITRNNIKVE